MFHGDGMLAMLGDLWAIDREAYRVIREAATLVASGDADMGKQGIIYAQGGGSRRDRGRIAVMGLSGVIEHRQSLLGTMFGGTGSEQFGQSFDALVADPTVKGIVFSVNSPGGTVAGAPELSSKIYAARSSGKPIVAVADTMMASSAYWIASSAHRIYASPSAEVGSIGVIGVHTDASEYLAAEGIKRTVITTAPYKGELDESQPLSVEAHRAMQQKADSKHRDFVADVARNRGVDTSTINSSYGQGRSLAAQDAKQVGMVDAVGTLEEVIGRMVAGRIRVNQSAAMDDWESPLMAGARVDNASRMLSLRSREHSFGPMYRG